MDHRLFGTILVVLMFIHTGLCIDCHQCASWDSIECMDPYEEDNVDGCDDRDTHCLKIKMVNKLYDSGFILGEPRVSRVVSRGCIRADGEGDYCHATDIAGGMMIRCLCSTDECNSSQSLVANLSLSVMAAVVALLLWRRP